MNTESNLQIVRRIFEEGFSGHNPNLFDQYFDPNLKEHQFGMKPSIAGMKEDFAYLFKSFPDYRLGIEDIVESDDKVWVRARATGTNTGGFMGAPNGKSFDVLVLDIVRIKDGKVVEHWGVPDRFALLQQLGMLPSNMG